MRGKGGKKRFFDQKIAMGWGRGKQTKRWRPPALLLSIHKQHKPALAGEPIKSSQANAGGEQANAACTQCAGKFHCRGAENAKKGKGKCSVNWYVLLAFGGCSPQSLAAAKGEQDEAKKKAVKPHAIRSRYGAHR